MPTAKELAKLLESFDWDDWNSRVHKAIEPHYRAIAIEQAEREVDDLGLEESFDAEDPFVERFFTDYLGERITEIDETTRDRIRSVLQDVIEANDGASAQELAGAIRAAAGEAYAFSASRALTIARTEAAFAYGHGAGLAFKQNGITHVEISDGDGDDECAEADGEIWTVDEYLANVIEHPNCVRSAAPADAPDESDDEE